MVLLMLYAFNFKKYLMIIYDLINYKINWDKSSFKIQNNLLKIKFYIKLITNKKLNRIYNKDVIL